MSSTSEIKDTVGRDTTAIVEINIPKEKEEINLIIRDKEDRHKHLLVSFFYLLFFSLSCRNSSLHTGYPETTNATDNNKRN